MFNQTEFNEIEFNAVEYTPPVEWIVSTPYVQ